MLILHGDDTSASRKRLWQEIEMRKKSGFSEVISVEGKNADLNFLKQNLESSSLFSANRLLVIENFFTGPFSQVKDQAIDYLKDNRPKNVIIWENKKIDGRKLLAFKNSALLFDLPKVVFSFLENVAPGKGKWALAKLQQSLKKEPLELIFYLLCRHISLLTVAKDLGSKGLKNLPPWKGQKLIAQAKKFSLNDLLTLYRRLADIDYREKSGSAPAPLLYLLEIMLITF